MRLDPAVVTEAMENTECYSIDEFSWKYLNKSGTTLRNYRDGKTVPPVTVLMVLKKITHRPLDNMIIEDSALAA